MAGISKKSMLLGLKLAAFVVAAACATSAAPAGAAVTIYNPANLVVDVLVDGHKSFKVAAYVTTVSLEGDTQGHIKITTGEGHVVEVDVEEGDALVIVPDPDGDGSLALKVQNGIKAPPLPPFPAFPPFHPFHPSPPYPK